MAPQAVMSWLRAAFAVDRCVTVARHNARVCVEFAQGLATVSSSFGLLFGLLPPSFAASSARWPTIRKAEAAGEAGCSYFPGHGLCAIRIRGWAEIQGGQALRRRRADQGSARLIIPGIPFFIASIDVTFASAHAGSRIAVFGSRKTRGCRRLGLGGGAQVFRPVSGVSLRCGKRRGRGCCDTVCPTCPKDILRLRSAGFARDEIHLPPLWKTDKTRHLFHLIYRALGASSKQQMCFVEKKKTSFGLSGIHQPREVLEKVRTQP